MITAYASSEHSFEAYLGEQCAEEGCTNKRNARGLCNSHYGKRLRDGSLPPKLSGADRFWMKVEKTPSCWVWLGGSVPAGYGVFTFNGRRGYAHRHSWEIANGQIPDGLQVDHRCHNRACVNPSHLRLASHAQNMQNLSGSHRDSKSGVRGVYWSKSAGKWHAESKLNGVKHHIGFFEDLDEAASAVAEWRQENMPYSLLDQGLSPSGLAHAPVEEGKQ